ncbi:unnamed protein product [Lymnaea stagnalis]|uniref:Uncharacterized protein n=1 Tax=Lymnaea stagnalis TaxID=6523 RepID=A0AAV2HFN3_LYMST
MSANLFVAILLGALMTSHWPSVSALPRLNSRQLTSSHFPYRPENSNVCSNYMEACVPWETRCCNNMVCVNVARGYCLYPLEKCMCQKPFAEIF